MPYQRWSFRSFFPVAAHDRLDSVGQIGASKSRNQAQVFRVSPTKRGGAPVCPSGSQPSLWKVATIPDLLGEEQLGTCAGLHGAEILDYLVTGGQRIVSSLTDKQRPCVALA